MQVGDYTARQAATGLFGINLCMLTAFWLWGLLLPRLTRRGVAVERLIAWGVPASLAMLTVLVAAGQSLGAHAAWLLALFCLCSSRSRSIHQLCIGPITQWSLISDMTRSVVVVSSCATSQT